MKASSGKTTTQGSRALQTWQSQDTVWMLGLFGTAIGAGVLFLPINAGLGGIVPLLIITVLAFPITYYSHRALARFVQASSTADKGLLAVVEEQFGAGARRVVAAIYFATIFSILLMYSIAVTNTTLSFMEHQLDVASPSRALVSIALILALLAIVSFGQAVTMRVMSALVYPFIASLVLIGLYLIPKWNFAVFSSFSSQQVSFDTAALMTLWLTFPVLVMSFNHFPIISPFVVAQKRAYGAAGCDDRCARIQRRACLLMVGVVLFFVYSCVLSLSPAELQEAKTQNVSVLSYLANRFNTPIMAYLASFIAFVGINKSFLGHYVGAHEVMRDALAKASSVHGWSLSPRTRHLLILGFTVSSCWLAAWLNINVLSIVESFAGPAGAVILLLLPMYAIRKVPALAHLQGRVSNVFITLVGLLTVSAILYGILG
ncbi:TPA: HAAAP family serine/threonine permease [Pseudomonas aeruginosa]